MLMFSSNHIETELMNVDSKSTGDYHVMFISRHPKDNDFCDDKTRWWPLWHEYKNDKNDVPIYGARMLFGPKRKLDSTKYNLWTDSVLLTEPSCYLLGPFNFGSYSDVVTTNQHVVLTYCEYLINVCNTLGIVSPILSTLTDVKSSSKKRKSRN